MVQLLHPDGQFFNAGGAGWSVTGAANTWEALDELATTPVDSDFVSAVDAAALLVVTLPGGVTNPGDNLNHQIRVRARVTGGPSSADLRVSLYDNLDGVFEVAAERTVSVSTSWVTYQIDLANFEGQSIDDYDNLGVGLNFSGHTSGATMEVSLVEVVVPDPLEVRATRTTVEVMARAAVPNWQVTRSGLEVMAKAGGYIRVTRTKIEVMAAAGVPDWQVTRSALEVMASNPNVAKPQLNSTRTVIEVMAKADNLPLVEALPLPAELPPIFLHNWSEGFQITTSWTTGVTVSEDVSREELWGLLDRPLRAASALLTGLSPDETRALWTSSLSRASQRMPFPIYSDHSRILGVTSATEISLDTQNRRLFPGQRVVAVSFNGNRPVNASYGIIESVSISGLTLAAPGITAVVGGRLYPCMDAEVSLEPGSVDLAGSNVGEALVQAREVPGPSSLPGLTRVGSTHSYQGIPIFLPPIDWSKAPALAVLRAGDSFESGLVQVTFPRGAKPRVAFTLSALSARRSGIWPTLRLFDGRRGRRGKLWALNPGTLMDVTAVTDGSVTVAIDARFDDLAAITGAVEHLGIIYADGSADVRAISAVSGTAGAWTFSLAQRIPTSKAIQRVTFAHLARFEQDSVTENWGTTESCGLQLSVIGG